MPVFSLDDELIFPHPSLREPDGLLAVGGDLSLQKLVLAYRWGIFPWYHEGQPILWWWTSPRLMMKPTQVHVSHSLKTILRKHKFKVTFDQCFMDVMIQCARSPRRGQNGTWITPDIIEAYTALHRAGHAHSVEVWDGETLVGGLYGVVSGHIFCGESMFALQSNASKVGFISLAHHLASKNFVWIDCQQDTPHMRSLGGQLVEEQDYLHLLRLNHTAILQSKVPSF